jgi:hypothetical protein
LRDLTEKEVETAIGKAIERIKFMPAVSELRVFAGKEVKTRAEEALGWWAVLEHRDMTKRGYRDGLPREVEAVFDMMGGCNWWNRMQVKDEGFERNRWVKLYDAQFRASEDERLEIPDDAFAAKQAIKQRRDEYKDEYKPLSAEDFHAVPKPIEPAPPAAAKEERLLKKIVMSAKEREAQEARNKAKFDQLMGNEA